VACYLSGPHKGELIPNYYAFMWHCFGVEYGSLGGERSEEKQKATPLRPEQQVWMPYAEGGPHYAENRFVLTSHTGGKCSVEKATLLSLLSVLQYFQFHFFLYCFARPAPAGRVVMCLTRRSLHFRVDGLWG
jgi:hypothetical protein